MNNRVEEKLNELGLSLPKPTSPGGNYVSVNIRGTIAYIAIQFPILNGEFHYQGRLGETLTTEQGYKAMQLCALNVLAHITHSIGFEKLVGLNHMEAYFQSSKNWDDSPKVVNGASDLLVHVLESKGTHSRSIVGVASLPRNFSVGLTATCTIQNQ